MRGRVVLLFVAVLLAAVSAARAQDYYDQGFGQNKIEYDTFDWQIYRSTHFQIYFYGSEKGSLGKVASLAESAYDELSRSLNYQIPHAIPLIYYATHAEFEETNTLLNFIPEGIGAFALPSRDRMVLPIDLPDERLQQLIQHELTHVFEFEILFQGNWVKAYTSSPPQWFMEGLASYYGHDEDNRDRMVLRDAVVNDQVPEIAKRGIEGYFAYRFGHAVFDFMTAQWGKDAVRDFVYEWRTHLGQPVAKVIKAAFGITPEDFDVQFRRYLRQRYLKVLAAKGEPVDYGERFRLREEPSWELSPVPLPSGDLMASISTVGDAANVVILDNKTRKLYKNLSRSYTTRYEYVVAQSVTVRPEAGRSLAVSPDGNYVASFVRREKGRDLVLFDVLHGGIAREIHIGADQALAPSFSPDGKSIAFAGIVHGNADVFLYSLADGSLKNLTNDAPYDMAPAFSPDGQWLYYSSVSDQFVKIYRLKLSDPSSREQVTFGDWDDEDVTVSPDGKKIYFTSDRDGGIYNIYSQNLETGEVWQHTNVVSGAFTPSVVRTAAGTDRLTFASYYKRGFSIYLADASKPYDKLAATAPPPAPAGPRSVAAFTPAIEVALDPEKIEKKASHKLYIDDASVTAGLNTDNTLLSDSYLIFSDNLGDRRLIVNLQSVSSYTDFHILYYNLGKRLQYGVHLFDTRLYYIGLDTSRGYAQLVRDRRFLRETGGLILGAYPLDRYHRFEANIGFVSRALDAPFVVTNSQVNQGVIFESRTDNDPTAGLSFIGDTTLYSEIGPLEGHRYSVSYSYTPDLKHGDEVVGVDPISGQPIVSKHGGTVTSDLQVDLRQYLRISRRSLFAFRLYGARSTGNFPNIYYFGGLDTLRAYDYGTEIGNEIAFGNAEFRFPLVDAIFLPFVVLTDIRGRFFVDVGAADLTMTGQGMRFWNASGHPITINGVTYQQHQLINGLADYGFGFSVGLLGLDWHWDFARQWDFRNSYGGFRTSFYIGTEF